MKDDSWKTDLLSSPNIVLGYSGWFEGELSVTATVTCDRAITHLRQAGACSPMPAHLTTTNEGHGKLMTLPHVSQT
jgi:hypothetical protein